MFRTAPSSSSSSGSAPACRSCSSARRQVASPRGSSPASGARGSIAGLALCCSQSASISCGRHEGEQRRSRCRCRGMLRESNCRPQPRTAPRVPHHQLERGRRDRCPRRRDGGRGCGMPEVRKRSNDSTVGVDAAPALRKQDRPEPTMLGIALTTISLAVMMGLARAKRWATRELGSRALEADAFPDDGLLVALAPHPRRRRPQYGARMLVGRPRRRLGNGVVPRAPGPGGLAP